MSFNKLYYANETPSTYRKISINILVISMVLAIYGWWANFIPATTTRNIGFYISFLLGVPFTLIYYWNLYKIGFKGRASESLIIRILAISLLPLMVIGPTWLVIVHGLPSFHTITFGEKYSTVISLKKDDRGGRRSCKYRLTGKYLKHSFPPHICVNEVFFQKASNTNLYKISGYKSFVGAAITNVTINKR